METNNEHRRFSLQRPDDQLREIPERKGVTINGGRYRMNQWPSRPLTGLKAPGKDAVMPLWMQIVPPPPPSQPSVPPDEPDAPIPIEEPPRPLPVPPNAPPEPIVAATT
jgi:hypothetical protein